MKCRLQKERRKSIYNSGKVGTDYLLDGYNDGSDVDNLQKMADYDKQLHMNSNNVNLQKEANDRKWQRADSAGQHVAEEEGYVNDNLLKKVMKKMVLAAAASKEKSGIDDKLQKKGG